MILRPLDPAPAGVGQFLNAWSIVERLERDRYESCWMITQPSHAALAGDIAARLTGEQIPRLDADLVRAIALHDAGWGQPDAQAIMRSRSRSGEAPKSFLQIEVPEYLAAWNQSVEIAQKVSVAGGYIVSRHFWRLAEHRLAHGSDKPADRKKLETFVISESTRQKKLLAKQDRSENELERLTDLLQFCDLLSLYICSGAQDHVQFPEYFGVNAKLTVQTSDYKIDPAIVKPHSHFSVAALRHPATRDESAREVQVRIE